MSYDDLAWRREVFSIRSLLVSRDSRVARITTVSVAWLVELCLWCLLSVRVREFRHGGIGGIRRLCELESTETKKTEDSCSYFSKGRELQANNRHYQEILSGKRNYTISNQFNTPKLIREPSPKDELRKEKINRNEKESPTWSVVRLSKCRRSSSCCPLSQIFLRLLTVQTVPLCWAVVVEETREKWRIVAYIDSPLVCPG